MQHIFPLRLRTSTLHDGEKPVPAFSEGSRASPPPPAWSPSHHQDGLRSCPSLTTTPHQVTDPWEKAPKTQRTNGRPTATQPNTHEGPTGGQRQPGPERGSKRGTSKIRDSVALEPKWLHKGDVPTAGPPVPQDWSVRCDRHMACATYLSTHFFEHVLPCRRTTPSSLREEFPTLVIFQLLQRKFVIRTFSCVPQ